MKGSQNTMLIRKNEARVMLFSTSSRLAQKYTSQVAALVIDSSKTFYWLDHNILIDKLPALSVHNGLVKLIDNF